MSYCCEDALAVYEKRKGKDRNPRIVRVIKRGHYHVYYRSDNHIHNLEHSPIPPYTGHPSGAPKKHYGWWTYITDKKMMLLV